MRVQLSIVVHLGSPCVIVLICDNSGKLLGHGRHMPPDLNCLQSVDGSECSLVPVCPNASVSPVWLIPVRSYRVLVRTLQSIETPVVVDVIPETVVNMFLKPLAVCPNFDEGRLQSLQSFRTLHEYQKTSVRFILQRGGRALNGSEMGTGKTPTGICFCEYYAHLSPQLIVCPSSLKYNWNVEFQTFAGCDVPIIKNGRGSFSDRSIISYSLLTSKKIRSKLPRFKVVVLDESHYIKNLQSKRTKLLLKLCKQADKVLLLTGTPSSKSSDLFPQLKAIDPTTFVNFFPYQGKHLATSPASLFFASRYCVPTKIFLGRNRFGFAFNGNDKSWELYAILSRYMTRRTKADSLMYLPPKTRIRVVLEKLNASQARSFQQKLQLIEEVRTMQGGRAADAQLMALVRETSVLKVKCVLQYVQYILDCGDNDRKYLLFAHHHMMLDAIRELLATKKQTFICIDGRTPADARQSLVDSFQDTRGSIRFAVLSIRAAGTGLNLYTANTVIFCELLWSEKDHIQAEDRAHRQNQTRPVLVQYLVIAGSTDELVWRSLSRKVTTSSALLDNQHLTFQAAYQRLPPQINKKRLLTEDSVTT